MSNRSQSSAKVTVTVGIKDRDHTVEVRVDPSQSSTKLTVAVDINHCDQTVKVMVAPSQSSAKVNVAVDIKHCDQTVEATEAVGIGSSSTQATPSVRPKRAAASLSEQWVPPSKRSKTDNHDKIVKAMGDYFTTTSGQTDDIKSCLRDVLPKSLSVRGGQSIINAFKALPFDQARQGLRMMLEDQHDNLNWAILTLIRPVVRIPWDLPPTLISDIRDYEAPW
ncbi:hypothetical protein LTS15_010578 [Exophiala xenobiotica]|nr:hypothetical protein LTS15_010578 [Exophiala xenobiotica]